MKKVNLVIGFFCLCLSQLLATHNRAGEITFTQVGNNTLEATILTYTNADSAPADRDTLEICWGDGICERIGRTNDPGELITPSIKKNLYVAQHTYNQAGNYTLSVSDPNRNGGILNVNFPNSDQVQFHLETGVNVMANLTSNNSPQLLQPPIDIAFVGQPFFHIPNAIDTDGDSLAYRLIVPMQDAGTDVSNYQFPDMIDPGPNNNLSINEVTGLITWDAPQKEGEYNLAIQIESYRNGELWDVIIRDMQITVLDFVNGPPQITIDVSDESIIEVEIGTTVNVNLTAEDTNPDQTITLSSTSELYDYFETPASFIVDTSGEILSAAFEWNVKEEHLRQQAYQVVFKAKDDFEGGAASFKVLQFKVVEDATSTSELPEHVQLNVYPNPAAEVIRIRTNKQYPNQDYIIMNSEGKIMQRGQITRQDFEIKIDQWLPGVYFFNWGGINKKIVIK